MKHYKEDYFDEYSDEEERYSPTSWERYCDESDEDAEEKNEDLDNELGRLND